MGTAARKPMIIEDSDAEPQNRRANKTWFMKALELPPPQPGAPKATCLVFCIMISASIILMSSFVIGMANHVTEAATKWSSLGFFT